MDSMASKLVVVVTAVERIVTREQPVRSQWWMLRNWTTLRKLQDKPRDWRGEAPRISMTVDGDEHVHGNPYCKYYTPGRFRWIDLKR